MDDLQALVPPEEMIFVGAGDYLAVGREFLHHFLTLGGLRPHHRVLDVGCGIGRMAVPLTGYLQPPGCYEGFDVVPMGIRWCQETITPRFPHFRFQVADIFQASYYPEGRHEAFDFAFPYPDASFDFAFLTSVFTHMLPADVGRYVHELARVLRPGGRCLITCFLLNDESTRLVRQGQSRFPFRPYGRHCWVADPNAPEGAIAYPEADFLRMLRRHGFDVSAPVHPGSWCGRADFLSFQDIVVVERGQAPSTAPPVSPWLRLSRGWRRLTVKARVWLRQGKEHGAAAHSKARQALHAKKSA